MPRHSSKSPLGARPAKQPSALFAFRDGRIVRHVDRFDLWRWLRQALGAKGALLGWLPPVQGAVQVQAAKALRTTDVWKNHFTAWGTTAQEQALAAARQGFATIAERFITERRKSLEREIAHPSIVRGGRKASAEAG